MNNLSTSIATTREQSERLLAMGVKSETADMYRAFDGNPYFITYTLKVKEDCCKIREDDVPAWSLSRLISMMPKSVNYGCGEYNFDINTCYDDEFSLVYDRYDVFGQVKVLESKGSKSMFECCVSMIDWLIKNNHFNKEYLKLTSKKSPQTPCSNQ